MRVSKEKAAEHRHRIVAAAARLFRERGIGGTGVDSITREAGLTHGAVYSQFGSKEAIAIDSIRAALRNSTRVWLRTAARSRQKKVLAALVESYLSVAHRDAPGTGCLVAALAGDISRQPRSIRDAFTQEFKQTLDLLADLMASDDRSIRWEDTVAAFAAMAGALMLARAVSDPTLSNDILKATSAWVKRVSEGTGPQRRRAPHSN